MAQMEGNPRKLWQIPGIHFENSANTPNPPDPGDLGDPGPMLKYTIILLTFKSKKYIYIPYVASSMSQYWGMLVQFAPFGRLACLDD